MRLRRLSLERFGRFEDCELLFRDGTPDLHIVYGANEAGKTTSMAAVSDLLFGIEERSRYNFLFEYPMLRIGADLEEDGRIVTVRRRKTRTGSLVDADDKAIDDGPLVAMLHGQNRDAFRLAFSLDHLRLREGGRAIVQARDDVGQALFAAGSGMTGVVATLAAIEQEADAIWGARAAQRRTYTQAERAYEQSRATARDRQIKPKAWNDAQTALSDAEAARIAAEAERDAYVAEQRRLERIRRIGPAMQRRADLLAVLSADDGVAVIPPAREERILAALDTMAGAARDRAGAEILLAEVETRIAALAVDAPVMATAEAIEAITEGHGADLKARIDFDRLTIERRVKEGQVGKLRRDVGMADQELPSRPTVTRLRGLIRSHGEAVAALRLIDEAREDLRARLDPLERRLADTELAEGLSQLIVAIDVARRLGNAVDERCVAADKAAQEAGAVAAITLDRLPSWKGDADALMRIGQVSEAEIGAVEAELALAWEARRTAMEDVRRLGEETERLALASAALTGAGQAVSHSDIAEARSSRQKRWQALRDGICGLAALPDPIEASDAFEGAMTAVDNLADQRFNFAEESGRLALLDQQASALELRHGQADGRRVAAEETIDRILAGWNERLAEVSLPMLEPTRMRGWLADRNAALDANAYARERAEAAADQAEQRRSVRTVLLAVMPDFATADELLAPVLGEAERRRAAGELRDLDYRAAHAEMRQFNEALATQVRSERHRVADRDRALQEWHDVQMPLGLTLTIAEGDARLSSIEELRSVADEVEGLTLRLAGIEADRVRFDRDLDALWASLDEEGEPRLDRLRYRLTSARAVAGTLSELQADRERRTEERNSAVAAFKAAALGLAPVLADLGGSEVDMLDDAVQASRRVRAGRHALGVAEAEVVRGGEGLALDVLEAEWRTADPDAIAARADALGPLLGEANSRVTVASEAAGDARRGFMLLDVPGDDAASAAADAEQARAEMAVQADAYLLKRAQAVTLRWAIERYRKERQNPLLIRASTLFRRLTLERYTELRIDHDAATPRLLGVRDDGRHAVDVEAMSDGTADQLYLALRLAAVEQSIAAGIRLPFLADDLFINFDDERSSAGLEVLAELATKTQVLFFTHHVHLAGIARNVVGADLHSECTLS